MKKLTYEDGHIVIRDGDGKLFWSSHYVDLKDEGGGYKEIYLEGKLIEKNDFSSEDKKFIL